MSDLFRLDGRVALVTGASRGLGFAMAEALAAHGAHVVINARDAAALGEAAARIAAAGHAVEPMAFDVTDGPATLAAMADIAARHGRLDILVNNAGVQHRVPVTEWTDADFERVLAVNLTACFRLAREAARLMLPRRSGRIISTGSVAAILGRPTIHAYAAAKAGLHGITRSLAAELGPHGHHRQRAGARLLRHRAQHRPGQRRGLLRLGLQAHPARPLGRAARAGRCGGVPGVGRRLLRHRPRAGRRRWDQRYLVVGAVAKSPGGRQLLSRRSSSSALSWAP